ncbi:MAG: hypothetical protein JSR21_05455 [Proteobacteria bacterium]|nr:hypothetical protein [Pseudomonadota bacterium]
MIALSVRNRLPRCSGLPSLAGLAVARLSLFLAGEVVKYLPPFDLIRRQVEITTVRGALRVSIAYEDFIQIIRILVAETEVDEAWYLSQYPDVAKAVREGKVQSAKQHFVDDGYFEGRLPCQLHVNEAWYLEQNPDVAEGIRQGLFNSATQHFVSDGHREGRRPAPP